MANRIQEAISKMEARLTDLEPEKRKTLVEATTFSFDEWSVLKSNNAAAMDIMTLEERQYVFELCTGSVEGLNKRSLHVKIVLTQLLKELIERRF